MKEQYKQIKPPVARPSPPELSGPDSFILDNGIPVYLIREGDEEVIRMDLVFRAGQIFEKIPVVSSTVNMMLTEGSEKFSAQELNKALDFYGAVPGFFAEKDLAGLSVAFLTKYLEVITTLCIEILFRPAFPEAELDTLMKKRLQWFDVRQERVQALAYDSFFEAVFGASHPYGRIIRREDFSGIGREMLVEFHGRHYIPGNMSIIMAGKIPAGMDSYLNSIFGRLDPGDSGILSGGPAPVQASPGRIQIQKKGAVQSALRLGSMTINKRDPDYFGLKITDTILGGYFGSRLMKNIREEKGYTYGISSSVVSLDQAGYKVISTEVGNGYVEAAVNEIRNEIKKLQHEPAGVDELETVKNYMLGEMVRMFDGPFAKADSFRSAWEFGLGYDYFSNLADRIKTITADEIRELASTYYNTDELIEVVVGPE